jgi:hypothetical protein
MKWMGRSAHSWTLYPGFGFIIVLAFIVFSISVVDYVYHIHSYFSASYLRNDDLFPYETQSFPVNLVRLRN